MTPEEEAAGYVWYAERWGWTPAQVDDLPAWLDVQLPQLAGVYDEVRADLQEEANARG